MSARPEPRKEREQHGSANSAQRKTDQALQQQGRRAARTRARGKKKKQKGRGGEARSAPAGECRRVGEDSGGGGDGVRSPAAAGPPTGAVAGRGRGVGRSETWGGWGVPGARVRGFLSFCIVAEGWEREESGAARIDCTIINGAEDGLKTLSKIKRV